MLCWLCCCALPLFLDGEHMAARRAYDSKLAQEKPDPLAKLASLIPPKQQQQQQQQTGTSKSGSTGNLRKNNEAAAVGGPSSSPSPSSSSIPKRNNHSFADKQQRSNSSRMAKQKSQQQQQQQQHNIFTPRSDSNTTKVKPASYAKKNNVNVKQWGRPKNQKQKGRQSSAYRPSPSTGANNTNSNTTTAATTNNNNNRSNGSAHRRSSDGDNNNPGNSSNADPMKNKTHARARNNQQRQRGSEDSCGDFSTTSTTDECSSTSDDDKRKQQKQHQQHPHQHTYSKRTHAVHSNHVNNTKPSSNLPTRIVMNKGVGRNHNNSRVTPRGEFSGPSKGCSVSEHAKQRNSRGASRESRHLSDTEVNNNTNKSKDNAPPPKSGYHPTNASKVTTDYSTFVPAVTTLEKQYHCPLTRQIMMEPMSDFEGNSYERHAILKYLETRSTSPVTGNPLYAMHLTPNSALKEKIIYTLKLKDCIDSLQNSAAPPLSPAPEQHPQNFQSQPPPLPTSKEQQPHPQPHPHHHRETKYTSLREAVNGFIKDLNSNSPAVTICPLDSNTGITSFTYLGLKFFLEVPDCVDNDQIVVQTWFDHHHPNGHSRGKTASSLISSKVVSSKVVSFNAALHKIGLGGCKLTYRNMMSGKHAFTLTKKMYAEEKFSKTTLRHGIEYFVEMSIKLHNIVHSADAMRVVDKVRLTNVSGVAAAAAGQ